MLNLKKKDELLEAKSRKVLLRGGGWDYADVGIQHFS
jgi:hypothetical protein